MVQICVHAGPSLVVEDGERNLQLPLMNEASPETIERWKRISAEFWQMQDELVAHVRESGMLRVVEAQGIACWAEALASRLRDEADEMKDLYVTAYEGDPQLSLPIG